MRGFDRYGNPTGPASQAEKDRIAERVRSQDEERIRNANGWARLCGMAAPIGGPSIR